MGVHNKLNEAFTPPGVEKTWLTEMIESVDSKNELWQTESLIMFHMKTDLRTLREMGDDEFCDIAARTVWIIEQEQKKWSMNAGE